MRQKDIHAESISPDELLAIIGTTPADNKEGFNTALPWKSRLAARQVRSLFQVKSFLDEIGKVPQVFGPLSFAASVQSDIIEFLFTGPIKTSARIAIESGKNPDIFGETNSWIYKSYAALLHELCGLVMTRGNFNEIKARRLSSTSEGLKTLKNYLLDLLAMELAYNSLGLTRLKAMKELLKCILILITQKPFTNGDIPFMGMDGSGNKARPIEDYLMENRARIENLYRADAFDIKSFSEKFTGGKIGYSDYRIVEDSAIHHVRLRQYPLPAGVVPNGKVLYLATPLINRPEIFDLAQGKSVIEGMLREGYHVYMVDHGNPGHEESHLGLDFYGKVVPDFYFDLIKKMHSREDIYVMAYCMAGTIILPYLARRAEERMASGQEMDIKKIALMATPVKFDDGDSGHGAMRDVIKREFDPRLMNELFGEDNVPSQVIEAGMNEIQPGVQYTVSLGFYARAFIPHAIDDAAPFLYWLTHGTRFPARAHREWIGKFFIGNELVSGLYRLPSSNFDLDGKKVDMDALRRGGVKIFCYRGTRDPIAPAGSCISSDLWGQVESNIGISRGGLNRTIEKNVGHIFVVSKQLLSEYLELMNNFFRS